MTHRPDILLVVLDTQRADRLSCYGYDKETSPNLDAFAADATLYRHAMAAAQWTIPSHASMFTGTYPSVHGTQHAHSTVPTALPTLAERLRDNGYFTAAFCNNPLVGVVNNGLRRGFLSFLNYAGWLTSRPNQAGVKPGLIGRYRQWFKQQLAKVVQFMQDSFARSDALLAFAFTPIMIPLWQTALSFKGNTAKSLDDAANLLIKRSGLAPDQPAFCFVNLMGTHTPYQPERQYIERFAPDVLNDHKARRYLQRFNSDPFGWMAPTAGPLDAHHKAIHDGMYDAEVATQDAQLGRFFERLRASGRLDETLVIICADHGEHLGEKQLMGHSFMLYRELSHVPLIVRDPSGALQPSVIDTPVSARRVFQTALHAAGIAEEGEQELSLLSGAEELEMDVLAEAVPPSNVLHLMRKNRPKYVQAHRFDLTRRALHHGDYKLILRDDGAVELYNVTRDPAELHELSAQEPQLVADLTERLLATKRQAEALAVHSKQRVKQEDDSLLKRQMRALGYLD